MHVEIHPEAATPPDLRAQVLALQDQAWPPGPGEPASSGLTHDPALDPRSILLVDDARVLAALDVVSKPLDHAGRVWAASGLSTVVVDRAARGGGHGLTLVRAAARSIETSGVDLTLFTCDRPLARFYEAAGYAVLPGSVVVGGTPAAPLRSDAAGFDKVTLAAFHSAPAVAARPAFVGVDLALYPGDIDRLW